MTRQKKVTLGADIEVFVAPYIVPPNKPKKKASPKNTRGLRLKSGGGVTFTELAQASEPEVVEATAQPLNLADMDLNEILEYTRASSNTKKQRRANLASTIVPCVGIFPGTKKEPYAPKEWPKGYAIQEDNVMLEYNIPPTSSVEAFNGTMRAVKKLVNSICMTKELQPVWNMPEHEFKKIDLESPQATMFACDPDMDAYTGGTQRDAIPNFGNYRTCGGHIHIGGDFNCPDFVAVLFLELVLSFYVGGHFIHNPNSQRSKWYGRPGIFRTKPYGIEYRTLSNSWANSPYTVNDVARVVFLVGHFLVETPANTLQQWFRSIEWSELNSLLLTDPNGSPEDQQSASERWSALRAQVHLFNIPGIAI